MHEHLVPMRWADLDSLQHVNNVVYLAYAAEGRAAMVADGALAPGLTPVTMTVRFLRPLRLGRRPVLVAGTVDGDDVVQQIALDGDAGRTVFAEVTTTMGRRAAADMHPDVATLPMSLRRDDLDADGAATATKVFELFQETRVLHISSLLATMRPGRFVVGTSSVTFRDDIRWRPEPLRTSAWISRVGNGSFEMRSELSDGTGVLADSTTTLVGFDPASQTAKTFDDAERDQLRTLIP
ncbi:thioesterase family protein [Aeromicrobium sp. Root472D3]|uniref:acyl-CoA thioesterase n=1 Tax=Aeromicrobium sp. Root472D3 TaxID=1736540 RepID=UPI0012F9B6B4|nr:hotdog domain-containing protein [Aeromicrobium sp. Root472D3]